MADLSDEDKARRRDGKRFNEGTKLLATLLNNSGIAIFVGAFVLPYVADPEKVTARNFVAILVAIVLHGLGQWVLRGMRSED